ncbi:MAG: tRNA pseudouridine(38-40) synthase TruA [Gammaproteobacteria bacterium]|nr:tRNA pseudouridine(38-40) synthase TruA [Gammaproteobacteria bacterium]
MRLVAGVEYDGTNFVGWQKQDQGRTVQQSVESAFSKVADHTVSVQCAGRTDSGVHAIEQVIHFDTESLREDHSWVFGVNSLVPDDININWVKRTDTDFHARFSALSRYYRYIILNRATRSSLLSNFSAWQIHHLNEEDMSEAAKLLIGKHDFTSFRATSCQSKTPIRDVTNLTVQRRGDFIFIDIIANAFLQHMVRNIVGVLMQIGCKKYPVNWAMDVLDAKDRTKGGITAPASGLYLMKVQYPGDFNLPSGAADFSKDFFNT